MIGLSVFRSCLAEEMRAIPQEELDRKEREYWEAVLDDWYRRNSARIEARAPSLFREIDEAVARNKARRGTWD